MLHPNEVLMCSKALLFKYSHVNYISQKGNLSDETPTTFYDAIEASFYPDAKGQT